MNRRSIVTVALVLFALCVATPALAQEHAAPVAQPHSAMPQGAQPTDAVAGESHAAEAEHAGNPIVEVGAKLLNFGLLVGLLVYFLRTPIAGYLDSRSAQIRQDLVTAAEMRAAATAQLAEIDKRMQELPAELEALKRQGAEDVKAEQARITQTAAEERTRLLEQTRREIDMRMRIARRELTEHAAVLAVDVAESRIRRTITPDDQMRLVDRYATQLAAPAGAAARATR
jgi:F-type H+-transporting ATPase subunit b